MTTTERSAEECGKGIPLTEHLPRLPADAWIGKDSADEPIGVVVEDGVPCPWYFGWTHDDDNRKAWQRATWEDYVAEILSRWGLAQRDIAAAERALRKAEKAYAGACEYPHLIVDAADKVVAARAALRALGVDP